MGGSFSLWLASAQQQSWPSTGSIWQSYLFYEDWDLSNAQVKDGAICPRIPQETTKTSVWILARFYYRASFRLLGILKMRKKSREIAVCQHLMVIPSRDNKDVCLNLAHFYFEVSIRLLFWKREKKSREIAIRQNIFGDGWPWKFFLLTYWWETFGRTCWVLTQLLFSFWHQTSCHIKIVLPRNKK